MIGKHYCFSLLWYLPHGSSARLAYLLLAFHLLSELRLFENKCTEMKSHIVIDSTKEGGKVTCIHEDESNSHLGRFNGLNKFIVVSRIQTSQLTDPIPFHPTSRPNKPHQPAEIGVGEGINTKAPIHSAQIPDSIPENTFSTSPHATPLHAPTPSSLIIFTTSSCKSLIFLQSATIPCLFRACVRFNFSTRTAISFSSSLWIPPHCL